ncbi:hypothetical protein KY290_027542 [Solanum tuberosum]|uniref:Uncharacterized protein n=1 Tax=Solanum tuberosum TaxID=4113 RepID=A0ABQ7UFB4_SOLTU|nr:hypothetical protein KY285_026476 [Solanum tuberosum]KAH0748310.1 hypothetical protein KY290_027542 [Solanum tuberosum]
MKLPQGSAESKYGLVSYVPQSEFDIYLKVQLANLEKAYAGLAKSHVELSISYNKMKKQEKSINKFFTRMWKGVKGLWKVLKANEPLLTLRLGENGDELDVWNDYGGAEDSEATDTNEDD